MCLADLSSYPLTLDVLRDLLRQALARMEEARLHGDGNEYQRRYEMVRNLRAMVRGRGGAA